MQYTNNSQQRQNYCTSTVDDKQQKQQQKFPSKKNSNQRSNKPHQKITNQRQRDHPYGRLQRISSKKNEIIEQLNHQYLLKETQFNSDNSEIPTY